MNDGRLGETLDKHLQQLLTDYHDLQAAAADVLDAPPSTLGALRMIHKAHPVVIRGHSPLSPSGLSRDWRRRETYLDVVGDAPLTVALTDDGLADSVRTLDDGTTAFVKALDERMPLAALLARLADSAASEVAYLQSQDGNIYRTDPRPAGDGELAVMRPYIERDVPWMREVVGVSADAVNLWIGDRQSATSLHHDPYDNIYHVICGTKTFTLVSPIEGLWLEQRFHPSATLARGPNGLVPVLDPGAPPIPWVAGTDLPPEIRPIVVTLHEGETLFLPAGWWHRVEQAEGACGLAVAVNYDEGLKDSWYHTELRPERYAYERLAQRVARAAGHEGVIPVDVDSDSGPDADVWGSGSEVNSADEWEPSDWGR